MEKTTCGCGAKTKAKFNEGLKKDAKAIVAKVEGLTKEAQTKRSAEVKAAFGEKTTAARKPAAKAFAATAPKGVKTTKPVAKPATKATSTAKRPLPKPAGISKGPHSGDAC